MPQICSGQTSYTNASATLAVSATAKRTGQSSVSITASWSIYTAGSAQLSGSADRFLVLCDRNGAALKYSGSLGSTWSSNTTYSGTVTFTGVPVSSTQTSLVIGFKVSASNTSISANGTLVWNGSKSTTTGSPAMQTGTVTFATFAEPNCSASRTDDYSLSTFSVFANCTNASSVRAAVWTGGSQSDIVWYTLGAGSWTRGGVKYNYGVQIPLSKHGGRTSYKNIHIYMYDSGEKAYLADSHTLYYAQTLYFNANGGTCDVTNKSITWGSALGELPAPTRTGYDFNGWYTSTSGGSKYTSTSGANFSLLAPGHTLYAQWNAQTYTITFDASGGTVAETTKNVTYGDAYGDLPIPARSGYDFLGWFFQDGTRVNGFDTVTILSDSVVMAHWAVRGSAHIRTGNSWPMGVPYVYTNDGFVQCVPYIYSGGSWKVGV